MTLCYQGTFRLYPLPDDPALALPPRVLSHLPSSRPVDCIVRVYVIRAFDLVPSDENGLVRSTKARFPLPELMARVNGPS